MQQEYLLNKNTKHNVNNILLINLKRNGDIFFSAHLISSIKKHYPQARISLLIYQEFHTAAKGIKHIAQIYSINRHKILKIKKSSVISHAWAVNELYTVFSDLAQTTWDYCINFSHDSIAAAIISFLNPPLYSGIKMDRSMRPLPANEWSFYFNEVSTQYPIPLLHYMDLYHRMCQIPLKAEDHAEINFMTDLEADIIARKNIENLRIKHSKNGNIPKIIGIQLKSSQATKDIPYLSLLELIKLFLSNEIYFPILLIGQSSEEKEIVNRLHQDQPHKLLTISADFQSLPSVLMQLDLLLTPDTSIKHLADLTLTPMLEVSLGKAPPQTQGSLRPGNFILAKTPTATHSNSISGEEIFSTIENYFHSNMRIIPKLQTDSVLYSVQRDSLGIYYASIAGQLPESWEISYHLGRMAVAQWMGEKIPATMIWQLRLKWRESLLSWLEKEKQTLIQAVSATCSALNCLKNTRLQSEERRKFLHHLDTLLQIAREDSLVSIACLLLRGRIELITSQTLEQNIQEMGTLLQNFKRQLSSLMDLFMALVTEDENNLATTVLGEEHGLFPQK